MVKLYFETMASGMAAKLDPRYRITNHYARNLGKLAGNKKGGSNLIAQFGYVETSVKK